MSTETSKSLSAEITSRLETTLVARCGDTDFFYEILDLRQFVDVTSVPAKFTIEFELALKYADKPNELLMFHARIEDLDLSSDAYYLSSSQIDLTHVDVRSEELKERMIDAFEIWSAFELKFSIES